MSINEIWLYIACVPLYLIGLYIHDMRKEKKEIREYPTKVYIDNIVRSIDNMNGREFEEFCAFIFAQLNYKVWLTPASRDGGKDVIVRDDKGKMYVEIKRYASGTLISRPLIQKLVGSSLGDGVRRCMFVTTSDFSTDAVLYANNVLNIEIELVNLTQFLDMCRLADKNAVMEYLGYDYEAAIKYLPHKAKRLGL